MLISYEIVEQLVYVVEMFSSAVPGGLPDGVRPDGHLHDCTVDPTARGQRRAAR